MMSDISFEGPNKTVRKGLRDMWNSGLYEGVEWTELDNPKVHATALAPPIAVASWHDAKMRNVRYSRELGPGYHISAFIHLFIDDVKFDGEREGIWKNFARFFDIAGHYDGILGVDFSTNADFPEPLKRYQFHRMRVIEHAAATRGITVIPNARWGTPETWEYCFDGLPEYEMLAVGAVGSGLRELENRPVFEAGLLELARLKRPSTVIVVGSAKYHVFDVLREQGIEVIQFDGPTSSHFKEKGVGDV